MTLKVRCECRYISHLVLIVFHDCVSCSSCSETEQLCMLSATGSAHYVCKSGSAFAWYSLASTKQRWFEHGQSIRRSHYCKTFTMTVEHLTRISSPVCTGRNELGKYEWRYKPADKCVYSKRGLRITQETEKQHDAHANTDTHYVCLMWWNITACLNCVS